MAAEHDLKAKQRSDEGPESIAGAAPGRSTLTGDLEDGEAQPLPGGTRSLFERSLGQDLSDVRVHAGDRGDAAARKADARAYAQGRSIFFKRGEYDPSSPEKQSLLAHEVAHTAQQKGAASKDAPATTQPGDTVEREADDAAASMMKGDPAQVSQTEQAVARKKEGEEERPKAKVPEMFARVNATAKKAAHANQATIAKSQGEDVKVFSPGIELVGDVALKPEIDPDPAQVTVGWVQVLESSRRVAIYEENGKVARRQIMQLPSGVLDGHWEGGIDGGPGGRSAPKPWYAVPLTIDGKTRTARPPMSDQPKFLAPKRMGKAKLVEVQGADTFTASLKAGSADGSDLTTLKNFSWATPWSMKISDKEGKNGFLEGEGSSDLGIASTDKSAEAKDQRHPNQIAAAGGIMVTTYESLEAAQEALAGQGYAKFVSNIGAHKELAPESYWHMVTALWKSTARIHAKIKSKDAGKVAVSFNGHRTVSLPEGKPFGDDFTYSALAHMVIDPGGVADKKDVTITVDGKVVCTLKFPYGAGKGSGVVTSGWSDWNFDIDAYIK